MASYAEDRAKLSDLLACTAKRFGVTIEQVITTAEEARFAFVFEADAKGFSAVRIGRLLRKDHTTILYWLDRIPGKVPKGAAWRKVREEYNARSSASNGLLD